MNTRPLRILLVDDHKVVREGFAVLMGLEHDLHVIGQAGTCAEARMFAARNDLDVVVLDLSLADGSGLDCIADFAAQPHPIAVLVLSSFGSDDTVFRALQAGAKGYVLKSCDANEIFAAVRAVARGDAWISPAPLAVMAFQANKASLTDRERSVLRLVAAGHSNEDVAAALELTQNTVKTHIYNIMRKLSAKNRTEAVARARQSGLLGI